MRQPSRAVRAATQRERERWPRSHAWSIAGTSSARARSGAPSISASTGSTSRASRSAGSRRATGEYKQVPVDEQPGSLVLREQGGMVVAFYGGFRFFDPETGAVETIHEVETDQPESRMNDGRCDRQGRFWAGSMDDGMDGPPARLALPARPRPQPAQDRDRHRRLQLHRLQPRGRCDVLRRSRPGRDLGLRPRHRHRRDLQQARLRRAPAARRASPTAPPSMPKATSGTRAGTAGASPASRRTARSTAPSRCPSSR